MYFTAFPRIFYDAEGNFEPKIVVNLLRRIAVRTTALEERVFFDTYEVKDTETPEILANKLYGDPELHWIIMLVNNITDRYHGWPKPHNQFLDYLNDKYTSSQLNEIHHYEISQTSGDTTKKINIGPIDTTSDLSATAVTNFEFEDNRNEKLRQIRLLDPEFTPVFVEEFNKLISESVV